MGVDENGKGFVYHYDAVGNMESVPYSATGTGSLLVMSVLDNQLGQTNQLKTTPPLDKLSAINLLKDVITSATARDIHTGDAAEVLVIDSTGLNISKFQLKDD
eukprot:GHVO01004857.1.p1 GENE.GHVO01004857.1~~GHVO01004857.1.p1  ORF type:complete len:103 (-),score=24.28 GHVO01004857.1:114-422(-)